MNTEWSKCIELRKELDEADEKHYDECEELRTQIAELTRKLRMKEVN